MTLACSINSDHLPSTPQSYKLKATPGERKKIAERLNLLSIDQLEAEISLQKKDHLLIVGKITAAVTQECVRTLVPFPQQLVIHVEEIMSLAPLDSQQDIDLTGEDLAEPLEGSLLDIGEMVIQLLSLNLDPYPVAPESLPFEYKENNTRESPFEALKKKE